jgi:uncharacterized protein (TIGR01777 family)
MPLLEKISEIPVPVEELFQWYCQPNALERLSPPFEKVRVVGKTGGVKEGAKVVLEVGPFHQRWEALHLEFVPGKQFQDEQMKGPFAKWIHTHGFEPIDPENSRLLDRVDYELPLGGLGALIAGGWIKKKLDRLFYFRHGRTLHDLKRLQPHFSAKPLRIVMAGASGLVGKELKTFLSCAGHEVHTLVRRLANVNKGEIFWDPEKREIDKNLLEGADAVIHLGGENIGASRWTPERKETIRQSRVQSTRFLAESLAQLKTKPKVFIVSSAIGFYGDRGEEVLAEESFPGKGFLPEACQEWERAADPARWSNIRTVHVRTGIVLSLSGGALPKMLLPFLMGAGGVIGSGKQWMSWIALEDLVGIFHELLYREDISGPVNATAPGAVTNREFTKVLGKVLKRPAIAPLPGFVVKLIFGEMGEALLLEGQNVKPAKLSSAGFNFYYPDLESALRWQLGKPNN